ncbi:phage integrase SAM-like domain-containing protein [Mucilaginibacter sp.]|uniref:phage integrase SAM-like domain-containing protein n=1 Tax=Mucilaginibacter sp. TaxID=1882438 RepID=UPI0035BC0C4E
MASVKAVLRQNKKSDGTFPLVIRITKDRKTTYISLNHYFHLKDWDEKSQKVKKSYPNAARLNNMIAKKLSETNGKLIELETNNTDTSSRAIGKAVQSAKEGTFLKQAALYIQQLKVNGKGNQLSADTSRVERFKEFLEGSDINFSEIDVPLLKKFQSYLKGTRTITERTVVNHLVVIRTIYNQAIENNLVDRKFYPFGKGKIKIKFPESLKIGLSAEDVKAIETAKVGFHPNHARNLWLFSFYLAGMRISDVMRMKWADIQNGRLYYKMNKNAKADSLKIPEKALAIIEQYRREKPGHDLVFPDLESLPDLNDEIEVQTRIKTRVRKNNEQLQKVLEEAKVTKKVTMHIARHSFGNISGSKISVQMLQKFYRHTSITTTMGYQANFIHENEDAALDSVVSF